MSAKEFTDWNKFTLDQHWEILENEFRFSSSGIAKSVFELIEFYKKHKPSEGKKQPSTESKCNKHGVNHRFLTIKNTHDWGISILYMEESGKAFARTYWYFDDESTIYFDWLNVIETAHGNGIATELLSIHLNTADEMKVESCLSVKKGTWMHEWYKRKGYKDLKDNEDESNTSWMNRPPQNGG